MILVLTQSPISAVFPIVRFAGDQKTALTGESLYFQFAEMIHILFPKLFRPNVRKIVLLFEKKCSTGREKLMRFEAEGLDQFIQTVNCQYNF